MSEEYGGNPKFRQFGIYYSINRYLMCRGTFKSVNFEKLCSILDVGCGQAPEFSFVGANNKALDWLVGIDISPHKEKWKTIAKENNCAHFIIASAHNLPFRSGIFDFIFIKDVLHHIPSCRNKAIMESYKTIKHAGTLRIIEANRYHIVPLLVFKKDNVHDHLTLDNMKKMQKNFSFDKLNGFEVLPSFSSFNQDFLWNSFVFLLSFLTLLPNGQRILFLFVSFKEKLMKKHLAYYCLSKTKV
jgi:SAM-dependent methyltransferase